MTRYPTRLFPLLVVLMAALGLGCASSSYDDDEEEPMAAPAVEPAKWNQERVTNIAAELATAVEELRNTVRNDPVSNIGSGQSNVRHRLLDNLRVMKNETRYLAKELEAGAGREATMPTYQRIGVLARNVQEEARKMFLHESLMGRVTTAGQLWQRLAPYYVGVKR